MDLNTVSGAEAAVATLQSNGVDTIFGIPGGHSLAFYDALARQNAIRHVLGRHEQGLAFMADGYSRASGKIGVLTTTSGPAVGNTVCAMGGATTDHSSVLLIASTVRSNLVGHNRGGLHDCGESIEIMRPVCRHVHRCTSADEIPHAINGIIERLRSGRPGSAYIEIPTDLLNAKASFQVAAPHPIARPRPDPEQTASISRLLAAAQRPVIICGTGCIVSGAEEEIDQLARRLGAVVFPTMLGRGILPPEHPNLAVPNGVRWAALGELLARADVVLAVGTMFKQEDTADWSIRPGEKLIHIDIDAAELGRSYRPHLGVVADAKAALQEILASMPQRTPADASWTAQARDAAASELDQRRRDQAPEMQAMQILRDATPKDAVIVCDRSNLGYWASRYMDRYRPRTFQYPMGYGGLGGALPQAIGAKIACPDRSVVCVIGDGGFQFTATELAVAVQEKVAVTIVLCNDGRYNAIRANQDVHFGGRRFGSSLLNPDFQQLAAAYGIRSVRAETLEGFEQALGKAVHSNELHLIEMTVDLRDPNEFGI